jgi:hypothetical protein
LMTFLPPGDKGYPHYLMNLARLAEVSYVALGHSKFKPVPWFHVAKKKSPEREKCKSTSGKPLF